MDSIETRRLIWIEQAKDEVFYWGHVILESEPTVWERILKLAHTLIYGDQLRLAGNFISRLFRQRLQKLCLFSNLLEFS